jgi:hypothetical protein
MKRKFPHGVAFTIKVEQEDLPVRGHVLDSGDVEGDEKVENEILKRLDAGDVWAWAYVTVIADCGEFKGKDTLGGCNYRDEADFRQDEGYFEDMKLAAYEDLKATLASAVYTGKRAALYLNAFKSEKT